MALALHGSISLAAVIQVPSIHTAPSPEAALFYREIRHELKPFEFRFIIRKSRKWAIDEHSSKEIVVIQNPKS